MYPPKPSMKWIPGRIVRALIQKARVWRLRRARERAAWALSSDESSELPYFPEDDEWFLVDEWSAAEESEGPIEPPTGEPPAIPERPSELDGSVVSSDSTPILILPWDHVKDRYPALETAGSLVKNHGFRPEEVAAHFGLPIELVEEAAWRAQRNHAEADALLLSGNPSVVILDRGDRDRFRSELRGEGQDRDDDDRDGERLAAMGVSPEGASPE